MARLERHEQDAVVSRYAAKDCGATGDWRAPLFDKVKHVHGLRCTANHSIRAIMWYVRRCTIVSAVLGPDPQQLATSRNKLHDRTGTQTGDASSPFFLQVSDLRCPPLCARATQQFR